PLTHLPRRARALLIAVVSAGAAVLAFAVARSFTHGVGPVPEFVCLTTLLALNWAFPLLLPKSSGVEALQLDEAFVVAMAMLLTPYGSIVAFAIGVGAGQVARRRSLDKGVFNVGQIVVSVALAQVVISGLDPLVEPGITPGRIAVILLGTAVFSTANQAAVA